METVEPISETTLAQFVAASRVRRRSRAVRRTRVSYPTQRVPAPRPPPGHQVRLHRHRPPDQARLGPRRGEAAISEIDVHVGAAMSGLVADARTLVDHARVEA